MLLLLLPVGVMEWQVLNEIHHHDCMMMRFIYLFRLASRNELTSPFYLSISPTLFSYLHPVLSTILADRNFSREGK